jgi:hypothetical protein
VSHGRLVDCQFLKETDVKVERGVYCVEDSGNVSEEVRSGGENLITGTPKVEYPITRMIGWTMVDIAQVIGS